MCLYLLQWEISFQSRIHPPSIGKGSIHSHRRRQQALRAAPQYWSHCPPNLWHHMAPAPAAVEVEALLPQHPSATHFHHLLLLLEQTPWRPLWKVSVAMRYAQLRLHSSFSVTLSSTLHLCMLPTSFTRIAHILTMLWHICVILQILEAIRTSSTSSGSTASTSSSSDAQKNKPCTLRLVLPSGQKSKESFESGPGTTLSLILARVVDRMQMTDQDLSCKRFDVLCGYPPRPLSKQLMDLVASDSHCDSVGVGVGDKKGVISRCAHRHVGDIGLNNETLTVRFIWYVMLI